MGATLHGSRTVRTALHGSRTVRTAFHGSRTVHTAASCTSRCSSGRNVTPLAMNQVWCPCKDGGRRSIEHSAAVRCLHSCERPYQDAIRVLHCIPIMHTYFASCSGHAFCDVSCLAVKRSDRSWPT